MVPPTKTLCYLQMKTVRLDSLRYTFLKLSERQYLPFFKGDPFFFFLLVSWWLSSKESAYNAEDLGSIPESGRSPGEGNGNPLQDSCLENPMDRGDWCVTVHEATKESDTS